MLNGTNINYNKINGFDRQWGCKEHIERGKQERWIKGKWNWLNRQTFTPTLPITVLIITDLEGFIQIACQ